MPNIVAKLEEVRGKSIAHIRLNMLDHHWGPTVDERSSKTPTAALEHVKKLRRMTSIHGDGEKLVVHSSGSGVGTLDTKTWEFTQTHSPQNNDSHRSSPIERKETWDPLINQTIQIITGIK